VKRWLIVLAVGCGSKPQPRAIIAEHVKSLVGLLGSAADYPVDPRELLQRAIATRCERDAWAADARACVGQADSIEALRACGAAMSAKQAAALAADLAKLDRPVVAVAKREPAAGSAQTLSFVIHVSASTSSSSAGTRSTMALSTAPCTRSILRRRS
jgi:hypothetical protein